MGKLFGDEPRQPLFKSLLSRRARALRGEADAPEADSAAAPSEPRAHEDAPAGGDVLSGERFFGPGAAKDAAPAEAETEARPADAEPAKDGDTGSRPWFLSDDFKATVRAAGASGARGGAMAKDAETFMQGLIKRSPHEPEFHQAVEEFVDSVLPIAADYPQYQRVSILERMTEPDRVVSFRVTWTDDEGNVRVNRAWRVQFNNALGPYKGGLRFDHSVTLSVLKFLGFEQTYKNALTGLPMGGGKGGANFRPRGHSDLEIMRFCHSLMTELHRHIGANTDVPAGDIGVGEREVGYLFGQYKRLSNEVTGVLTGKGLSFGGSQIRKEATGYGAVYFVQNILARAGESLAGKSVLVSGSGNVAIYAAEKAMQLGGKVLTLSDRNGTLHDPAGFDPDKLALLKDIKEVQRGSLSAYTDSVRGASYKQGKKPWSIAADIAIPCATQNELDTADAQALVDNGAAIVAEGANMPVTLEAAHLLRQSGVVLAPAKAVNAGGVATSGLEQSQNAQRIFWTREEVDAQLQRIMAEIHDTCVDYQYSDKRTDYVEGANIAGFIRVSEAMLAQGVI